MIYIVTCDGVWLTRISQMLTDDTSAAHSVVSECAILLAR